MRDNVVVFFVQTLLGTVNFQKQTPALLSPLAGSPEASLEYLEPGEKYFFGENHYLKRIFFLWEKENAYLWSWRRFSLFQVLLPHSIQLGDLDNLYHHIVQ